MPYGFVNQISSFCDYYILFCTFFCQGTFFVTVLWKFDKIKNFWLFFFFGVKDERRTMNQLKFIVRLGKPPTEALKLLQEVYGDEMMSRTRLFERYMRFKEGREMVEDDYRSGRPSTSRTDENVERVRQKVRSDGRLTVRMIADELGMNSERVWRIITEELGMRRICAKMVPRLLNEGQKERRVKVCQDILEQLETEPNLLKRVVSGDESRIFEYDPLTKRQSLEWKSTLSPRPKKVRVFKSKTKVMLIAFFDDHGIVLAEFLSQGQIINQHVYKKILQRLMRLSEGEKKRTVVNGVMAASSWRCSAHNALGIQSFLPKITLLYWSNHSTLQIWPLVTSFCFPNSRKSSKELVFKIQKPLKQPWRRSSEQSQRNPSRSAWKRGRGDWKSAFEPKEITLKATCCKIYLPNKIKHI